MKYPFIYIPGMFDNGDMITAESLMVKNINDKGGFYDVNYFKDSKYTYNKEGFVCSSNIVGAKYNRLIVANLIADYRTNISIFLMSDRFFSLMQGRAPKNKNYNALINYKGNDYSGTVTRDNKTIYFKGIIEETWAKYGKRVYYKFDRNNYRVVLSPDNNTTDFYINDDGYFDKPEDIKFNFIVHSSGGLAIRRYIQMCLDENLPVNVNSIINLSVPQRGARMLFALKNGFPAMINDTMNKFYENMDTGFIEVADADGNPVKFTYKELEEKTRVNMMHGDGLCAKAMRKIIGDYILYFIPFDGRKDVLGNDPALWDLNPKHRFIKILNKAAIPEDISIYNYKVKRAYSGFFYNLSRYLKLEENDGVVDYRDTDLTHIPGSDKLVMKDIIVDKANHIPFPYIKPIYELKQTIAENYGFLKILLKKKGKSKEENITVILALMKAIMQEMDFDLDYFLKNEDYSVIDYFAEHPVLIN
jgi:hypothetical protein